MWQKSVHIMSLVECNLLHKVTAHQGYISQLVLLVSFGKLFFSCKPVNVDTLGTHYRSAPNFQGCEIHICNCIRTTQSVLMTTRGVLISGCPHGRHSICTINLCTAVTLRKNFFSILYVMSFPHNLLSGTLFWWLAGCAEGDLLVHRIAVRL